MSFAMQHWVVILIVAAGAYWLGSHKPTLVPFLGTA